MGFTLVEPEYFWNTRFYKNLISLCFLALHKNASLCNSYLEFYVGKTLALLYDSLNDDDNNNNSNNNRLIIIALIICQGLL